MRRKLDQKLTTFVTFSIFQSCGKSLQAHIYLAEFFLYITAPGTKVYKIKNVGNSRAFILIPLLIT